MQKATRQHTKNHNTRLVLRTIYRQADISRADIARATGLSRPTVSRIVDGLMTEGFVLESGRGPSAGGKRPTLLNVAYDDHLLLALDLSSGNFRAALINLRGDINQRLIFDVGQCRLAMAGHPLNFADIRVDPALLVTQHRLDG